MNISLNLDLNLIILITLSANPTKWSNTLKQFVGKLTTNCLSVFDHFVGLALKELYHMFAFAIVKLTSVFIFM